MPAPDPNGTPAAPAVDAASADAAPATNVRDRVLLAVFWGWAALLLVAALAHLFGWDGVLDVLDVKRWFAR